MINKTRFIVSYRDQRGFTLIEVLVVLLIIAIITAVAVMAFGQFGRGRRELIIAQQFARVIPIAQQQAIITPVVLGLGITHKGYRFYQYDAATALTAARWVPLQQDGLSNSTAFQKVFQVDVNAIAGFDTHNQPDAQQPQILFLPNGWVTAFTVTLVGSHQRFIMQVKNNGATTLTSKTSK